MTSTRNALLYLADGYSTRGYSIGCQRTTIGKLVFNTSMTGYQEILTDPSYAGEIITFTFPLIGIYGVTPDDAQSERIHARGLIVSDLHPDADNWRADRTLNDLLLFEGVAGLGGIDTRRLTRHLRDQGEMLGVITTELSEREVKALIESHPGFGNQDLVKEVTCTKPYVVEPDAAESRFVVAAYDFGIKRGIVRCLNERGCRVHVFPATAAADELMAVAPDGVFLSNGPGDPERMGYVLPHVRALAEQAPVFGICLGHQLLALAAGVPTYRLKFGNRGANHPVLELESNLVHISSQNHSYAVSLSHGPEGRPAAAEGGRERAPLGEDRPTGPFAHPLNSQVEVTHLNVNDGSCEGLRWKDKPVFSVQYHPEGCPGPRDNTYLFDRFVEQMAGRQGLPADSRQHAARTE